MSMITKREFLFESGVQYGHRTSRLNPKMNVFIWGKKNGIHLINIALTEIQLSKAESFLEVVAENGKQILALWCLEGTQEVELEAAGDVEIINMMGESSMSEATRGNVKVKISGNPTFVRL